jgi:hypothetical protein
MIRCVIIGASKRGKSTTNLHANKEALELPAVKVVMRLMMDQEGACPKGIL